MEIVVGLALGAAGLALWRVRTLRARGRVAAVADTWMAPDDGAFRWAWREPSWPSDVLAAVMVLREVADRERPESRAELVELARVASEAAGKIGGYLHYSVIPRLGIVEGQHFWDADDAATRLIDLPLYAEWKDGDQADVVGAARSFIRAWLDTPNP